MITVWTSNFSGSVSASGFGQVGANAPNTTGGTLGFATSDSGVYLTSGLLGYGGYFECTVTKFTASGAQDAYLNLGLNPFNNPTNSGVFAYYDNVNTRWYLSDYVSGVETSIANGVQAITTNDVLKLSWNYDTGVVSFYVNGSLVCSGVSTIYGKNAFLQPQIYMAFMSASDLVRVDDFVAINETDCPALVNVGVGGSGTGGVTPTLPNGIASGDLIIIATESGGGEAVSLGTANGFAQFTGGVANTGSGTAGTRCTIFGKVSTGSDSAPAFSDPGDHLLVLAPVVYRNANTGSGINAALDDLQTSVKASASTSFTAPGVTTTGANRTVVVYGTRDNDASSTTSFTSWSNADLTVAGEMLEGGTTSGNGGGGAIFQGYRASAGSVGTTTATVTSSINASITIAIKPPSVGGLVVNPLSGRGGGAAQPLVN